MFFWPCFRSSVFCLLLVMCLWGVRAQTVESLSFTPGQMSSFDVDRGGNVYAVSKNKVSCFDHRGTLLTTLVFQSWPSVDRIDASSFHTVLCYNRDLSSVYFSDNKLSHLSDPVKLGEYSLYDLGALCQSHHSLLSLYNNQTQRIEVYDKQLNKQFESMEVSAYTDLDIAQLQLAESDSYLLLRPNAKTILVFNPQCAFVKRLDVPLVNCISAEGDRLVYSDGRDVFWASIETGEVHKLDLPRLDGRIRSVVFRSNCIYVLLEDGIHAFSIKDVNQ